MSTITLPTRRTTQRVTFPRFILYPIMGMMMILMIGCSADQPTPPVPLSSATPTTTAQTTSTMSVTDAPASTIPPFTSTPAPKDVIASATQQIARSPTPAPTPIPMSIPSSEAFDLTSLSRMTELSRFGNGRINDLRISPDGDVAAVASSIGIFLYNYPSFTNIATLESGSWFSTLAISSDSSTLAASSGAEIWVWDLSTRLLKSTFQSETKLVTDIQFSPDNQTLAVVGEESNPVMRLWNINTGEINKTLRGPSDRINAISFSPGNNYISGGDNLGSVWIWDLETSTVKGILKGHATAIQTLLFLDEQTLISSAISPDHVIRVWDLALGRAKSLLSGHEGTVFSMAVTKEKNMLATAGSDLNILVWNLSTGFLEKTLGGHADIIRSLAFTSDNNTLISSTYQEVFSWDTRDWIANKHANLTHLSWIASIQFESEAELFAIENYGNTLRLWSVYNQMPIHTWTDQPGTLNAANLSVDGSLLVTAGADGNARLYQTVDKSSDPLHVFLGTRDATWTASISHDNAFTGVAAFTEVRVYDNRDGSLAQGLIGHASWVTALAFSPDENTLATGSYQEAWLWDLSTGSRLMQLSGQRSFPGAMGFDRTGAWLAVGGGANDHDIRIYEVSSGRGIRLLSGHTAMVTSLVFHPIIDTILVSASKDGSIRLWDIDNGELLIQLDGHTSWVNTLAFNADGKLLVSGSVDGTVRLWGIEDE